MYLLTLEKIIYSGLGAVELLAKDLWIGQNVWWNILETKWERAIVFTSVKEQNTNNLSVKFQCSKRLYFDVIEFLGG